MATPQKRSASSSASDDEEEDTEFNERSSTDGQALRKKTKGESSSNQQAASTPSVFSIGTKKKISVGSFKGQTLVNIREYYLDRQTGEEKPGAKGIALTLEQWEQLKEMVPFVDTAISSNRSTIGTS